MSRTADNYLLDLGRLLKEMALDAKQTASKDDFGSGRLMAFHTVLSLLESQADVFGIPRAALSLDGFDADRDLLGIGPSAPFRPLEPE